MSEKNAMTLADMALTVIYQRAACCSLAAAALSSCFLLPAKAGSIRFLPLEERWELGRHGQFKPDFKDVITNYPGGGYRGEFLLRDGRRRQFQIWVINSPLDKRVVRYGTGLSIKRTTFNCLSSKQRDWVRSKVLLKAAYITGCYGRVASYSSQPVKYGRDPLRNPQVVDFIQDMAEKYLNRPKKCPPGYMRQKSSNDIFAPCEKYYSPGIGHRG